jgi:REP element-mobilizing transposase RayT
MISKYYPQFLTVTCLNWTPLLSIREHRDIVIESLRFLVKNGRVKVSAFVLMSTHFHLIWQVMGEHKRENVQRDFLKFTAQQILKSLRNSKSDLLETLVVNAEDRKYQVWERNSLGIELRTSKFSHQKMEYIHSNPVEAGLCQLPENYEYSSARFYELNDKRWDFLSHFDD